MSYLVIIISICISFFLLYFCAYFFPLFRLFNCGFAADQVFVINTILHHTKLYPQRIRFEIIFSHDAQDKENFSALSALKFETNAFTSFLSLFSLMNNYEICNLFLKNTKYTIKCSKKVFVIIPFWSLL